MIQDIVGELRAIMSMRMEMRDLNERIERLRSNAARTTSVLSDGPRGTAVSDKTSSIDKALELQEILFKKLVDCETRVLEVEEEVDRLPRYFRQVLKLRYFQGLEWAEVANVMHYSISGCTKIHRRAIDQLTEEHRKVYQHLPS